MEPATLPPEPAGSALPPEPAGSPTPSDTTVEAVLAGFAEKGFTVELWAKPGGCIMCGSCRTTSPAAAFDVELQRRLEGASDPADMQLVVGATCPECGEKGAMSLHYGPAAGADDADVVVALPR